jgi:acyl CoA:acetate/3-ketoacid CoA transferase alpha subunit
MKAGFAPDGTMITLRDLVSGRTPPASIESLTERQLQDLTVERLRRFPDYRLQVLGRRRPVTQRTAIQEVEAGTKLGRFLVETERNIIRLLLERIRLGRTENEP